MECEIMQVLLEEAREGYEQSIVHPMASNNVEDIERNVREICQLLSPLCTSH